MKEKNKSILIFTDKFPFGTSEAFFENELLFLAKSFDKVALFPLETNNSTNHRTIPNNIELITPLFNSIKNKRELIKKGIFNSFFLFPLFGDLKDESVWKSVSKIRNWITSFLLLRAILAFFHRLNFLTRLNNYDVIYFYWGIRWSQIIPFLPKDLRSKIVVRFHGSDLYEERNHNYIPFRKLQVTRMDLAVFISEMGKKYFLSHYPTAKCETYISRLGTKDYGIGPFSKTAYINLVSCSNIIALKQLDIIANSLRYLRIPVKWTHLGEGSLKDKILSITSNLPDSVTIDFKGQLSYNELISFYKSNSVDVFLNISSSEGIPVSVMEAISFGIPVIATNVGGTSEIVNDEIGYLVQPSISPQELAQKIKDLISRTDYSQIRVEARLRWEKLCREELLYPEFIAKLTDL